MRIFFGILAPLLLVALGACTAEPRALPPLHEGCRLEHPIVLSHHWGARKICPDDTEGQDCELREEAKNCAQWVTVEGERSCAAWRVPVAEQSLPPRNVNVYAPELKRDLSEYHRYFSPDVIARLEDCGNEVYIADKPPFASVAVRARSLRNTVLQALDETGASKVNLIGVSQGAQDARYLAAVMPVSDTDPSEGRMRDVIASIVTLAGEDGGAEAASITLDAIFVASVSNWSNYDMVTSYTGPMHEVLWEDSSVSGAQYVLVEGYDPSDASEYGMREEAQYRTFLYSLATTSDRYMQGRDFPGLTPYWSSLRTYLGMVETGWDDVVSAADESDNGIEYYGYSAIVRKWDSALWGDGSIHNTIWTVYGANDGYVTEKSSKLTRRGYPNFHHLKTLSGNRAGRGYHHMFFTGRADHAYQPDQVHRDTSRYGGSSADFYQQVARDLAAFGF